MNKKYILLAVLISSSCLYAFGQQATGDRLLSVLRQELNDDMKELQQKELRPYYMSFRVEDEYKATLSSEFGAELRSTETHLRTIVPQLRLGSKELDNFKFQSQGEYPNSLPTYLPLEDEADAGIRTAIWRETLKRYEFASAIYEQTKIQASTSVGNEDKAPCFSDAPVEKYYEAPVSQQQLNIRKQEWQKKLDAVSATFKDYPELSQGTARIDFLVRRIYFVNTEGSEVVQNRISARIMLSAQLMADDGMELPLNKDYFAYSLDSLPDTQRMVADAKNMIVRLKALKEAPVADPYTGPAILSGAAGGVFFHEIFGHRLEGHRLKTGGETFKKMVGKLVLPETFQVYSDPLLTHYAGTSMNGHYLYDEEGVKARRVNNVENGILREFLMSRVPLDGFPHSNGHGRATGTKDAVSRQSNLVVETSKPYTEAELRKMLVAEAKKQGKEYGYYYKTVTSGFTYTGEGGSLNSFNVTPLEVYRVFTDGRPDQLVRGVDLIGTPLAMFSKIEAGGGTAAVFTGSCGAESGWVPVTASSPMIYVSQIETQRRQRSGSMPPILPAPAFKDTVVADTDALILNAMKDELMRNQSGLKLPGNAAPFYQSYIATRYRQVQIMSTLGALTSSIVTPWRMQGYAQVLVGSFKRDNEIQDNQYVGSQIQSQPDYSNLRRNFWVFSDAAYKYALQGYSQKMSYLQSKPLPSELEKLPDMQRMLPVTKIELRKTPFVVDHDRLEVIANELSGIFKDYKELFNTSVVISGDETDIYRATSENVNLKQPISKLTLVVNASVRVSSGASQQDTYTVRVENPDELPSLDVLKQEVKAFADNLAGYAAAPLLEEAYSGPVMYEDEAVAAIFSENLTHPGQLIALKTLDGSGKTMVDKIGHKIIDPRITVKNYTLRTEYNGIPLIGHYAVDADGITPAEELTLVEKGVFKQMLNGRHPVPRATTSTGSARFSNNPVDVAPMIAIGTMHVQATGTTDADKMKKELLKAAKKAKQKFAYIVRLPKGYGSLQLFRVDVKSGEETRVYTGALSLPTLGNMEKLIAISAQENVQNRTDKVNTSLIYPSAIIINDMEIAKGNMPVGRTPALTYPLQR